VGRRAAKTNTRQSHTNSQPSGRLGDMRRIRIHRGKALRDRHRLAVLALDPRDPDVVRAKTIGRSRERRTR
jgi:hypothetical protein